jgi:hypothetical protein
MMSRRERGVEVAGEGVGRSGPAEPRGQRTAGDGVGAGGWRWSFAAGLYREAVSFNGPWFYRVIRAGLPPPRPRCQPPQAVSSTRLEMRLATSPVVIQREKKVESKRTKFDLNDDSDHYFIYIKYMNTLRISIVVADGAPAAQRHDLTPE